MRVAIADDSALFREGLLLLLTGAGVSVVAQGRTGEELLTELARHPVDVVVLDLQMPPSLMSGLVTAQKIRADHPEVGILMLSAHLETSHVMRLLSEGGRGLGALSKDRVADLPTLLDALERLISGDTVVDQSIVARLFTKVGHTSDLDGLSDREREVLRLMAEGRSNGGIAAALHLSERTIENHTASIFDKLALVAGRGDNRRVRAVLAWLKDNPHT